MSAEECSCVCDRSRCTTFTASGALGDGLEGLIFNADGPTSASRSDTKLALKQSQSVRLSVAWIGAAGFEVFKVDAKHAKWSLFVRCAGPLQ